MLKALRGLFVFPFLLSYQFFNHQYLVECSYLCFLTWIIFIKIQLLVCWQSIPSLPLAPLSLSQTFLCFFLLDDNSLHWLVGCNTFSKLHELLSEFLVQFETYAPLLTYFCCNILWFKLYLLWCIAHFKFYGFLIIAILQCCSLWGIFLRRHV